MKQTKERCADSTKSTMKHQAEVMKLITRFCKKMDKRARQHDASKLVAPEKEGFDRATWKLSKLKYGSKDYAKSLADLKVTLKHHYQTNDHHPEHYPNGVKGMTLYALVEMFYDWSAAVKRHKDGDIYKSIEINSKRFKLSPQLKQIFINTADADKMRRKKTHD